nr:hypothetical protein [uncultured Flavobacterium sp.]
MTNQQILNALYPVRQAYREAIEDIQAMHMDDPYDYLYGINMEEGMCLVISEMQRDLYWLMKELSQDIVAKTNSSYWYPRAEHYWSWPNKIIPQCLQPRLDHLNRTIGRLENEVNEYEA